MSKKIDYQKIIDHLSLMEGIAKKNKVLIIVEEAYLKSIPTILWKQLNNEFLRSFNHLQMLHYQVGSHSRKAHFFKPNNNKITQISAEKIFQDSDICFDFLSTGQAFYKKIPPWASGPKRIVIIRLSPLTWTLFAYNSKQVESIRKRTSLIKDFLQANNHLFVNRLSLTLPKKKALYAGSGFLSAGSKTGGTKYLPLELITMPTSQNSYINQPNQSGLTISGELNLSRAVVEEITSDRGSTSGPISMSVDDNIITALNYQNISHRKDHNFKILNVSFGTNHLIQAKEQQVQVAERTLGNMSLCLQNPSGAHVDICFQHKLF